MAAGKRYSAGAIFLQVVPVFANVQKEIERHAKDIDRALGTSMEKSGEEAGRRAGKAISTNMRDEVAKGSKEMEAEFRQSVDKMAEKLNNVPVNRLSNKMRTVLTQVKKDLAEVGDLHINGDGDFTKLQAELNKLEAKLKSLKGHKVAFTGDFAEVLAGLHKMQGAIRDNTREITTFEASFKRSVDKASQHLRGQLNPQLKRIRDDLIALSALRIGVEISASQAERELAVLTAELKAVGDLNVEPDVKLGAAGAFAELAAFDAAIKRVDGRKVNVRADADTAGARANLFGLRRDTDDTANSFRAFSAILLFAAGVGPALIPVLGAIAGGLLALGPAAAVAGAGLGSVLVGFSGISGAMQALQQQQDASTKSTVHNAHTEATQARAVARARQSSADAIASALKQQADAQRAYQRSIDDVKQAEQKLAEQRAAHANDGKQLNVDIKQNSLDIAQAQIDSFNAQTANNATKADGSATVTDKAQAQITADQALAKLEQLRLEQEKLAAEKKKWDKDGVNGVDAVKSAQQQLLDAIQRQKDAYRNLGEAAKNVDKARREGAQQVADALAAQGEALGAVNTQQANVDNAFAKLGVAGGKFARFLFSLKKGFYEFRDAVQQAMLPGVQKAIEGFLGSSSAKVIRDVLIGFGASFGKFAQALSKSFQGKAWTDFFIMLRDVGPKIYKAYGTAFIKLFEALASVFTAAAPFALQFANGLASLMTAFADWAKSKKGVDGIQNFLNWVHKVGPTVMSFFGDFVDAAVNLGVALAPWGLTVLKALDGFLKFMASVDPKVLGAITAGILAIAAATQVSLLVTKMVGSLTLALSGAAAPWILLVAGIAAGLAFLYIKNDQFRKFIDDAWKQISASLKVAWEIIKPALELMGKALLDLWNSIQPLLDMLGPILVWLIKTLIPILAAAWAAQFYAMAWVLDKVMIPIIKVLVKAIVWAVKKVIVPTVKVLAKVFDWLWKNVLKPTFGFISAAWATLVNGISWFWNKVLKPVFDTLGRIAYNVLRVVLLVALVAVLAAAKATFIGIEWLWKNVLSPVFHAIASVARWLWKNALAPVFRVIGKGFRALFTGMKWAWEHILKPVFDFIAKKALPPLQTAFQTAIDGIKKLWGGLKKIVAAPIKFFLQTVLNDGLIAGFNKVASWVGIKGKDGKGALGQIDIPKGIQNAYATGGVLPGYTPGRDVHEFVSPTAGRLALSGGEAIMRPEWTQAMGKGYIDTMNALARSGGAKAIKSAMGFATGGVIPLKGGHFKRHTSGYSDYAGDYNYGSGYDDYGMPVRAFWDGVIKSQNYIGDRSYGRWVDLAQTNGMTSRYAHLSAFGPQGVGAKVRAGDTIGHVGDIGNTGTPPTSHLHFELMGGGANFQPMGIADGSGGGGLLHTLSQVPAGIVNFLKDPIGKVKGWATDKLGGATEAIKNNPMFGFISAVPNKLYHGFVDKALSYIPGWMKDAAGFVGGVINKVGDGLGHVKDGVGNVIDGGLGLVGLKDGGILPYNGTMKYDAGGYLPPGLTSVMNLTGKPEPVFTNDQWSQMGGKGGAGADGGGIHYEPHFNGSDLTANDVAGDMMFTFRRLRRGGRYQKVGQ